MYRFYINTTDIHDNKAEITGQDARHLINVLRISLGDKVELFDGKGLKFIAEVNTTTPQKVKLVILEKSFSRCESPIHITIAQGMLKDKKMDMLIRHLTELGISEWIPFFAARSIPKPDKKRIQARIKRWERIAKEALKQCGRSSLPKIKEPVPFKELMEMSDNYDEKIAFFEKASCPIQSIKENPKQNINKFIILIGPEGGFSDLEINFAKKNGFNTFSLGPRILRAETASITACSLIQNFFGDLGSKKFLT